MNTIMREFKLSFFILDIGDDFICEVEFNQ